VGGGEQLVAAVAAGSAASPPSLGPEPSPMDVDEVAAGVSPGWAASPPSPVPESAVAGGAATVCRLCGGLGCVAALARSQVDGPAEGGGGGGRGGVLCRVATIARPPVGGRGGRSGRAVPPPLDSLSLAFLVLIPFSLLSPQSALPLFASPRRPPRPLGCDNSRPSAPPRAGGSDS